MSEGERKKGREKGGRKERERSVVAGSSPSRSLGFCPLREENRERGGVGEEWMEGKVVGRPLGPPDGEINPMASIFVVSGS